MTTLAAHIHRLLEAAPWPTEQRPETLADRLAQERFVKNLAGIAISQPALARQLQQIRTPLQWTFGRDGYLTARDANNWWTGCSVPLAAGREMMKSLDLSGTVGCFLWPTHAGQLRACFERLSASQALVAIIPDLADLAAILHCDDFTPEIRGHRLLFAGGWDWSSALSEIFKIHCGLPIPLQFVRTILLDDSEMSRMIHEAQSVFSKITNHRAERINLMRSRGQRRIRREGRICVVAPDQFDLANLSGRALWSSLLESDECAFVPLNTDDPISASPMALASIACESDAIVTADCARTDLPGVVPTNISWISWITDGRIPAPDPAVNIDRILLADTNWRAAALSAGWRSEQISFASWPAMFAPSPRRGDLLGLIVDTIPIEMPKHLNNFSSHMLLWEAIADELSREPLAVGNDPRAYLSNHIRQMSITEEDVDHQLFIKKLIEPAYHQGIARALIAAKLPVGLIGEGWSDIASFADFSAGPLAGIDELSEAARACRALIHPGIKNQSHSIDAFGIPVVRPQGPRMPAFIQRCRIALAHPSIQVPVQACLSPGKILSLIPSMTFAGDRESDQRCGAD